MTAAVAISEPSRPRRRAARRTHRLATIIAAVFVAALVGSGPASAAPALSVSPRDGLSPDGATTVNVRGSGYDTSKGIYVAYCVVPPAGQAPSPCGGGADVSGSSGGSVWISDAPPPYGEGLARPYGAGGSFDVRVEVTRRIGDVDCTVTRCAVVTRTDHTRNSDRSQDVIVPVSFAAPEPAAPEPTPEPTSAPRPTPEPAAEPSTASSASSTGRSDPGEAEGPERPRTDDTDATSTGEADGADGDEVDRSEPVDGEDEFEDGREELADGLAGVGRVRDEELRSDDEAVDVGASSIAADGSDDGSSGGAVTVVALVLLLTSGAAVGTVLVRRRGAAVS